MVDFLNGTCINQSDYEEGVDYAPKSIESKLFIDYDGTIVDTMDAWIADINSRAGCGFTNADVTHWHWFNDLNKELEQVMPDFNVFDWFNRGAYKHDYIKPFSGSKEFLKEISSMCDSYILTATHCDSLIEEKNAHAKKHFGKLDVIHHMNKSDFAMEGGVSNFLIDDKNITCKEWAEKGGIAFLINLGGRYSYIDKDLGRRDNVVYVESYQEVISYLRGVLPSKAH